MAAPTLIYDDSCPMCKGYTAAFQRVGWCERMAFSAVGEGVTPTGLDLDRARHEIPLVDAEKGKVYYGLDAMTQVMADGLPRLRPVLRSPLLRIILTPLYKIITYNRRIIAGTHAPATGFDCAPDRHVAWRLTYVLLMVGLTFFIGMPENLALLLGGGGLLGVWISRDRLTYFGHLATVAFLLAATVAVVPTELAPLGAATLLGFEVHRRM